MKRGIRALALAICGALLLSMAFAAVFAHHDCGHADGACPICLMLRSLRALLSLAALLSLRRAAIPPARGTIRPGGAAAPMWAETPVSRKVKLLD